MTFPTNNQETEWNVTYKKERELATDWKGKGNIYKRTEKLERKWIIRNINPKRK